MSFFCIFGTRIKKSYKWIGTQVGRMVDRQAKHGQVQFFCSISLCTNVNSFEVIVQQRWNWTELNRTEQKMCVRQQTLNRHFYDNFYYLITLKQIASLYYLFCHFFLLVLWESFFSRWLHHNSKLCAYRNDDVLISHHSKLKKHWFYAHY